MTDQDVDLRDVGVLVIVGFRRHGFMYWRWECPCGNHKVADRKSSAVVDRIFEHIYVYHKDEKHVRYSIFYELER